MIVVSPRNRRKETTKVCVVTRAFRLGSVDQDELDAPKIDISLTRIKKGNKIGEGSFGSVFRGTLKDEKTNRWKRKWC